MTQPIDVVYVEVRSRGEKQTAKDVKKTIEQIENDVEKAADEIEKSLTDATTEIEREFRQMGDALEREAGNQEKVWKDTAKVIGYDITEAGATARYAVDEFADEAEKSFKRVRKEVDRTKESIGGVGRGAGGAIGGGILQSLTSLGSQVMSLGALLGPIGTGALVVSILAAIPAVIGLVGALAQLSGALLLLPAAFGAVISIAAPLVMAFSGIGDAVEALASGDLEKINEAMKNLSPSARAFAREINELRKPLKDLRMDVQESFFKQFRGDLTEMVTVLLPTLNSGLSRVSAALGRFARDFIELLGAKDIIEVIGDVFESTTRIVDNLRPRVIDLFGVLFGAVERGLPFLERASDALGDLVQRFTNWLSGTLQDGSFERFLEGAFETFQNLWDLAGSVGRLLVAIFGDAGDEGNDFIQQLTGIIDKMTEFFESADGKETLDDLLNGIQGVVNILKILAWAVQIAAQGLAFLVNVTDGLIDAVSIAVIAVGAFFVALWQGAQAAWGAVLDFFETLGGWLQSLGGWFVDAWNAVVEFFSKVVQWFIELPGRIWAGLQLLPGVVIGVLTDLANRALYTIGFMVGSIVKFFMELPGRLVAAGAALLEFLYTTFITARDFVVATTLALVETVVAFFIALPGRVWDALVSIVSFVSNIFTSVYNRARTTVSNLVTSVVGFFQQLPGRASNAASSLPNRILSIIRDLASRAVDAGRNVMEGVARGIRNGVNSAINAAKSAARQVLRGFWDSLGIGSPSKVAAETVGAPIMQGVGVGVEDEAPQLKDVINRAMIGVLPQGVSPSGTGGGGHAESIVFSEGAISVSFEGVVPTEDEARQVGANVAHGIADTLSRRNVRTSLRTV